MLKGEKDEERLRRRPASSRAVRHFVEMKFMIYELLYDVSTGRKTLHEKPLLSLQEHLG